MNLAAPSARRHQCLQSQNRSVNAVNAVNLESSSSGQPDLMVGAETKKATDFGKGVPPINFSGNKVSLGLGPGSIVASGD